MPTQKRRTDAEVKRALRLAELKATDEHEMQHCLADLTDPQKGGLSREDAVIVAQSLRDRYIREILAEEDEDDDDDAGESKPKATSDEAGNGSVDDVEFTEDVDDQGDVDEGIETDEALTPAEDMGMGDLEDEVDDSVPFAGVPSEEEDVEFDEAPGDVAGFAGDDMGGGPADFGGPAEQELQPGENVFVLPDGTRLTLEVPEDAQGGEIMDEEVEEMPNPGVGEALAQRRAQRQTWLRMAQQAATETIEPGSQEGSHKNLGEDTSHGGKPFQMEDGTLGVATPGEDGGTMTLKNSDGNSLKSDPKFTPNAIYTKTPELLQNKGAKDVSTFSDEVGGLFTESIKETPDKLPTEGFGATDSMGWQMPNGKFDVPTQMPEYTGIRKTTVAAALEENIRNSMMTKECAGCNNPECKETNCIGCPDCGSQYYLCTDCETDDECPVCATLASENLRAAELNWDAYCGTAKDRQEVVGDDRGDDLNGDGGFRAVTKGGTPKDKNAEDMNVDAGSYEKKLASLVARVNDLEETNQNLRLAMAKTVKAAETAAFMVSLGELPAEDITGQMNLLIESDMGAAGIESMRRTLAHLAKRRAEQRFAGVQDRMTKEASKRPISSAHLGIGFNPNPSQDASLYGPSEIRTALSGIFTTAKPKDEFEG